MNFLQICFCCLTFPGGRPIQLNLDDLLLLWPPTNLRQVKRDRQSNVIRETDTLTPTY